MAYVTAAINKLGDNVTAEDLQAELNKILGDTEKNDEEKKTEVKPGLQTILYVTFKETNHNYEVSKGTVAKIENIPEIEYMGIILTAENANPDEVTYTDASGNPKNFTDEVQNGDIVIYGDYEYHYNQSYTLNPFNQGWYDDEIEGWGVRVLDASKEVYGELCGSIFGKPLTAMNMTFGAGFSAGGATVIIAPKIPNSVIYMGSAFQYCSQLSTFDTIPKNVKDIDYVFFGCSKLIGTITIDANPESYYYWNPGTNIVITGKSTMLDELAEASNYVTVK